MLPKLILYGGGTEAELRAGRAEDGDVDRPGIKMNPLIDPAQPAVHVVAWQLPSLVFVLRQKADRGAEKERDGDRRAQNAKKSQSGHPFFCSLGAASRAGERRASLMGA